jgi:hypothetical protein
VNVNGAIFQPIAGGTSPRARSASASAPIMIEIYRTATLC